jgi:Sulfotransferase domain
MTLPNFLVIGAQRAGTSLLHTILAAHPEVCVPSERKEIQFFDRYFERGPSWYQDYFPPAGDAARYRAIGEATAGYLAHPDVPARVHALIPDCRLVAVLRNPVERAFSWYQYARRSRNEGRDLETFLEADPAVLDGGLYGRHLQRWFDHFPRASVKVMIYEELVQEPARELGGLAGFLGLERSWDDPAGLMARKVNTSEIPRFRAGFAAARRFGSYLMQRDVNWPTRIAKRLGVRQWFGTAARGPRSGLPPATRARLAAFYEHDVARLALLLQRDLDVWPLHGSRPAPEPGVP